MPSVTGSMSYASLHRVLRRTGFVVLFSILPMNGTASGAVPASTQEHQHPSAVGEKLGTVHFDNSCSAAAKPQFDRAVALLHSFEFSQAITGFNQTLLTDRNCTIAYWGIALSRWGN